MTKKKTESSGTPPPQDSSATASASASDATSSSQETIAELQQKIAELTEVSKRAMADLQNYKRRTEEEKKQFVQFANAMLMAELLPVLDNFERAASHIPDSLKEHEWVKGMVHIEKQLLATIQKAGLQRMPSTISEMFDPNRHEALLQGPGEKNVILEELEAGYLLAGKVIRPAKVKVGDGRATENL